MFRIVSGEITPEPITGEGHNAGNVVFEGRVRQTNDGKAVEQLEYEAFDDLAVRIGDEILAEALTRFTILTADCVHRVGLLQIGDVAIRVVVQAEHRKPAFEACDWIVDEVKRRVPIWKKEHYVTGASDWLAPAISHPRSEGAYYSRQVSLAEVTSVGQAKLGRGSVLIVGAGGLGCSCASYLAAAGVGKVILADGDLLDESNLHRQVMYSHEEIGLPKAELAARHLRKLNPYIMVEAVSERVSAFEELLQSVDLAIDCTDNFRTKFALNKACVASAKPLVAASIYQFEGQVQVVTPTGPCLRCLWNEAPIDGCVGTCAEVGVLGVVPGLFGCLEANEALKMILGLDSPLREGRLLLLDLVTYQQQLVHARKRSDCPVCGTGEEAGDIEVSNVPEGWTLVDIREAEEVHGAPLGLHCPLSVFSTASLDRSGSYVLVCASGSRSSKLAMRLRREGHANFYSLTGGADRLGR